MECVFCGIASGKIPSKKVYEDEKSLAFLDINPRNPGHTLVIPKKHYATILDMPEEEAKELFSVVRKIARAAQLGVNADGVSIAQSNGQAAGQVIPHVHFHVIPRFLNEGPVGLESILPGKRLDEAAMKRITEDIKTAIKSSESKHKISAEENNSSKEEINFDF